MTDKEPPMRKITLRLSDAEYAALEQRARHERRSVREMAEFLVVQPSPLTLISPYVNPAPFNPIWPPNVWCGTAADAPMTTYTSGTICSTPNDAH